MRKKIIKVVTNKIIKFGLKGFTMDDIATELSISKKTIYKHFDSKKEVIRTVISTMMEESIGKMEQEYKSAENNIEKLKAVLTSFSENARRDELFLELKKHYPEIYKEEFEPKYNYRKDLFIDIIKEIYQDNDVEREININLLVIMLKGFVEQLNLNFLMENNLTLNDVLKDLQHLILYGILGKE